MWTRDRHAAYGRVLRGRRRSPWDFSRVFRWLANSVLKAPDLRFGLVIGSAVVFLNVLHWIFHGGVGRPGNVPDIVARAGSVRSALPSDLHRRHVEIRTEWERSRGLFLSALLGCVLLGISRLNPNARILRYSDPLRIVPGGARDT